MNLEAHSSLVLDASLILKWVLDGEDEPGRPAALRLLSRWERGEVDLLVPTLWLYEVGNILIRKRPGDVASALEGLEGLDLLERGLTPAVCSRAAELALAHRLTFYDASYLALAEVEQALLVTADARLVRSLPPGLPVALLDGTETKGEAPQPAG